MKAIELLVCNLRSTAPKSFLVTCINTQCQSAVTGTHSTFVAKWLTRSSLLLVSWLVCACASLSWWVGRLSIRASRTRDARA